MKGSRTLRLAKIEMFAVRDFLQTSIGEKEAYIHILSKSQGHTEAINFARRELQALKSGLLKVEAAIEAMSGEY